ncbi:hypothetical protein HMPREF9056_00081 [Actinomyces sp. oral taxon 170 str. F0386]|nr:hypothetical protein HMPREF9056_00081 [Actinomyces sp. oral taxon 170 str. F0386]
MTRLTRVVGGILPFFEWRPSVRPPSCCLVGGGQQFVVSFARRRRSLFRLIA